VTGPSPTGAVPAIPTWLTPWSLVALGLGLALGIAANVGWAPWVFPLGDAVAPLGTLWINALRMTVLPLIVAQLLAAIGGHGGTHIVGLSGKAMALFVSILVGLALLAALITPIVLAPVQFAPETVSLLRSQVEIPEAAIQASGDALTSFGDFVAALVPTNVFQAAAEGNLLHLLVFTVLFALAVTRLPDERREPLAVIFRALATTMMTLIVWILWATPVAVFAIILDFSADVGVGAAGVLVAYAVLASGLLLAVTGAMYPFTAIFGRVSMRRFARAVAPAQMVALSSRSSLATVPALMEGGRRELGLPESATGFVIPFAASIFKPNTAFHSVFKFLFLAHVFAVPLTTGQISGFIAYTLLLSFTSLGLPRGGVAFRSLPAYVAVGVPIEGLVILEAVKTIPDFFMTLTNTTGYMSVATILSRGERHEAPAGGAPVAAGTGGG